MARSRVQLKCAPQRLTGAVQLAQDPPNGGDLTSTNAEDVLIVSHFNELAGRITTAAGGGVQSITGANGLTATGTTDVNVSGIDAAVGTKGVVVLDNTVADVATTAATPKAINDYAVPLNLGTLQELT